MKLWLHSIFNLRRDQKYLLFINILSFRKEQFIHHGLIYLPNGPLIGNKIRNSRLSEAISRLMSRGELSQTIGVAGRF